MYRKDIQELDTCRGLTMLNIMTEIPVRTWGTMAVNHLSSFEQGLFAKDLYH